MIKTIVSILKKLEIQNNFEKVNNMILNKAVAQNSTIDASQSSRALSLLMEEMAVWYPAPYYDIEAMLTEEARGFKSKRDTKTTMRPSKSKRSLVTFNRALASA